MTFFKLPDLESQILIAGRIMADLYGIDISTATQLAREGVASGKVKLEDLAEHVIADSKKQIEFENNLKKEVR